MTTIHETDRRKNTPVGWAWIVATLVWLVVTPLSWTIGALLSTVLPAAGLETMRSGFVDQAFTLVFFLTPWLLLAVGQAIAVQLRFAAGGRRRVFGRWLLAVFVSAAIATVFASVPGVAGVLDQFSVAAGALVRGAFIGLLVGVTTGFLLQRLRNDDRAMT